MLDKMFWKKASLKTSCSEKSVNSVVPWKIDFLFFPLAITCLVFGSVFSCCYVWFRFLWRHIWRTTKWIVREDVETFIISTFSIDVYPMLMWSVWLPRADIYFFQFYFMINSLFVLYFYFFYFSIFLWLLFQFYFLVFFISITFIF